MTPVALHGASSRILSNGLPSHHSSVLVASAALTLARKPSRARV